MAKAPAILTEVLSTQCGRGIGVLTLNVPKAMNAVDLDMVNAIDEHMKAWQDDANIVAVIMRGAGEKAFCAGGDIRKLYRSMTLKGRTQYRYADDFFRAEYRKNYVLHQFTKPLIAWGQGFVMGGGLGLFVCASHRIGTESLRLAWPEVRIGLFPDVTATWYLSHMPAPWGLWMGLTGSLMNASECKQLGLTHYAMGSEQWQGILELVTNLSWQDNIARNHQELRKGLQQLEQTTTSELPAARLEANEEQVNKWLEGDDLVAIAKRMSAYKGGDEWLQQGIKNLQQGCPATAHIVMEQIRRGGFMSLKEVVAWELDIAWQSVRHPDFAEGVRAMVIDKDFKPQWQHKDIQSVPRSWVEELLRSPWKVNEHPYVDI